MSFVDLLSNDVWSEADIVRRTEALVRSEFSVEAEAILNRKVSGVAFGVPLTAADQAEVARFSAVVQGAQAEGVAARADMALLQSVLDHEAALARLALPPYAGPATVTDDEGGELPYPDALADTAERTAAQALADGASAETLELYALRHPQPEVDG